jgi:hypothetical protein
MFEAHRGRVPGVGAGGGAPSESGWVSRLWGLRLRLRPQAHGGHPLATPLEELDSLILDLPALESGRGSDRICGESIPAN